jgi:hypothetical protein
MSFLTIAMPLSSAPLKSEPQQQSWDQADELIIELTRSGGYEGTAYTAIITSDDLSPAEKQEVRKLMADGKFFELPSKISSQNRRCFDCGQIKIFIQDAEIGFRQDSQSAEALTSRFSFDMCSKRLMATKRNKNCSSNCLCLFADY